MGLFNNPRVANATALLALVVAMGSTAYAANTVRSVDIVNGQVKTKDLAKNAVKSAQVKDGSLTAADLAAGTAPKTAANASFRTEIFTLANNIDFQTVLSLSIPSAGSYVIWGKAVVNNNDAAGQSRPFCQVKAGTATDYAWVGLDDNTGFDDVGTANMMLPVTLNGPTTVTLDCRKEFDANQIITVEARRLVAIKVDSLVNTAASGPAKPARPESK